MHCISEVTTPSPVRTALVDRSAARNNSRLSKMRIIEVGFELLRYKKGHTLSCTQKKNYIDKVSTYRTKVFILVGLIEPECFSPTTDL